MFCHKSSKCVLTVVDSCNLFSQPVTISCPLSLFISPLSHRPLFSCSHGQKVAYAALGSLGLPLREQYCSFCVQREGTELCTLHYLMCNTLHHIYKIQNRSLYDPRNIGIMEEQDIHCGDGFRRGAALRNGIID